MNIPIAKEVNPILNPRFSGNEIPVLKRSEDLTDSEVTPVLNPNLIKPVESIPLDVKPRTFQDLVEKISNVLEIDEEEKNNLIDFTKGYDIDNSDLTLVHQIDKLIETDGKLIDFEKENITESGDELLKDSYNDLKKNLARMQVLISQSALKQKSLLEEIVDLKKSSKFSSSDILKKFIEVMNKKVGTINDILEDTLQTNKQIGGSYIKDKLRIIKKYLKYKYKYLKLKKLNKKI